MFNRVLVTGGSGFIGTHLVTALVSLGREVVNLDVKPPVLPEHAKYWREIDVIDRDRLVESFREIAPDAVIHLAARANIEITDWSSFTSIHEGTSNLLLAAAGAPTVRRIINTSTQYVAEPGYTPESDTDYRPYTAYGEAKAYAERLFFKEEPRATWLIVRPTNIWGPGHPSFAKSVWRYLAKRWYLHPSVTPPVVRTYGYVGNTVRQYIGLLNAPDDVVHRKVFYLGDSEIDSSKWLDAFSLQLTGKPVRRVPIALLKCFARLGDFLKACRLPSPLDSQRVWRMSTNTTAPLQKTFDVAGPAAITLEDGVAETVKWLRAEYPETYSCVQGGSS